MAASAVSASLGAEVHGSARPFRRVPRLVRTLEGCGLAADRVDVVVVGQVLVGQMDFGARLDSEPVGEHAHVQGVDGLVTGRWFAAKSQGVVYKPDVRAASGESASSTTSNPRRSE